MSAHRRKESDYIDDGNEQAETSRTVKIFSNRGSGYLIQFAVVHCASEARGTGIAMGAWQFISESFPTLRL